VWAATLLPTATINFNPGTLGLTQLPTWYWVTGVGGGIQATVNIRGYQVVTTASPVAYYWQFGDGGGAAGSAPGSEAAPSATHTYTTKGRYTVQVIVGWNGSYTFTGYGIPAQTVQLGTVDGPTDTAAYGVQEIRSVGVAP
jgi:PKD repeat protein